MTRQVKERAGDTTGVHGHPVWEEPRSAALGEKRKSRAQPAGRKTRLGQTPTCVVQEPDPLIRAQPNLLNAQERLTAAR